MKVGKAGEDLKKKNVVYVVVFFMSVVVFVCSFVSPLNTVSSMHSVHGEGTLGVNGNCSCSLFVLPGI